MIVTIHQPDFLPWLGFFDRWQKSDLFIVLDDVQYLRRGWQNRDKIKTSQGVLWLTVPVKKKGFYHQEIRYVFIDKQEDWKNKHFNIIKNAYHKAPNFNFIFNELKDIYCDSSEKLIDLNINLLKFCANLLKIKTPLVYSSSYNITSKKNSRLVDLIKAVDCDTYLTGLGSKNYLQTELFKKEGIDVLWQEYHHPQYCQLYGNFVPGLSILDYLMMNDF